MTDDRITLGALMRSAVRGLPDSLTINKGVWNLATAWPDRRLSLGLVLEKLARRHPGRIALSFEQQRWTYRELNERANRYADLFRAQGIGQGDVVGIFMGNHPEVLACVAATVKLGGIAGMLNNQQRGSVLAHSLNLIKPKLLVAGSDSVAALAPLQDELQQAHDTRLYWLATEAGAALPAGYRDLAAEAKGRSGGNPPETATISLRSPCFYIFTSGTTGMPKASVMTHYRWVRSMAGVGQMALRLRADDVFYCALPLYHNNALTVSWSAVFGAGCTLALGRKFSVTRFWDEIRAQQATAFCYIGELCRYLLNQPPGPCDRDHAVRLMVGNGLRPEIWDAFKQRFGIEFIAEFYGASECNLAFINGFGLDRTAGFCPLPYAIVEFDADREEPHRDATGHMVRVAPGGIGLLISEVSDKLPFDGYTDPEASEKKLLRNVFEPGDCWFNSGDLVRDQGFRHIQFVDRVGDTFRWKGENVATTEVEAALAAIPEIELATVYGVQLPGADGRAGMAAVTLREPPRPLDLAGLAAQLQTALPAYAVPVFLRISEALETTGTFKTRKVELKQQGFDPARVGDPLYVLLDRRRGYEPLTPELHARIRTGGMRL